MQSARLPWWMKLKIVNSHHKQIINIMKHEDVHDSPPSCHVDQSILITNIKININIKMFRPQVQSTKIPLETKSIDHNQNYFVAIFLRTDKN